jgi:superfamily II DNA/RNA helicase
VSALPSTDVSRFADLGVPPAMADALARRAITIPTPIQAVTIPEALDGRDVCGKAPTGSGKTLAFGIPLVLGVGKAKPKRPRGLVLAPTRELAAQITKELELLAKPKGPWIAAIYGGVGFDRQLKALNRGVDIVVACPGRLADLVSQRSIDLRDVDFVVIDEADRMADMGFLPEVKRLLDACATDRQTLLFSATLDGDVDVLIKRYQRDPARHEHVVDEDDSTVDHVFWKVDRTDRVATTAQLIDRMGPTVVFCRTKRGTDRVARQLSQAGVSAAAIHGDRSQAQRDRALKAFRDGDVKALVATDVAARGIHVDNVAVVVHYDPAADGKAYVHRSGRTARAGATGLVVSMVPPEMTKDTAHLQRELGFPTGLTASGTQPAARNSSEPKAQGPSSPRPGPSDRDKPRPSGAARRKAKRLAAGDIDTVASLAQDSARPSRRSSRGRNGRPPSRSGAKRSGRQRRGQN